MDSGAERTETRARPWHRAWRFPALMVFGGGLLAACSASSKDPVSSQPGTPTTIAANSSTVQTGLTGQAVNSKPSVKVTDDNGVGVPGVAVTFTVTAGGGSLTGGTQTTNGGGVATVGSWTLGAAPGQNTVSASATGVAGTVDFHAAGGVVGAGFAIQLQYLNQPTPAQQNAFNAAATRWSQVITGDLGAVNIGTFTTASFCGSAPVSGTVNDLLIIVDLKPYDGAGKVLGAATLCYVRDQGDPSPGMPLIGYMFFDTADLANLEANGALNDVILHEMGHILGIGTMWDPRGFLVTTSATTGSTLGFNGANAISAYNNLNGATSAATVQVEDTAVAGTGRSHWKEGVFKSELMTGYLSGSTRPLSATTIGSLADLGYTVDLSAADPFNVQSPGLRAESVSGPVFDLTNDIIQGPIQVIDRVTGLPKRVQ